MRICIVHNRYRWPGGEDRVADAESALLAAHGHSVSRFTVENAGIEDMPRLTLARRTVWNGAVARQLREQWRSERTELAHFHNTFPLISPAALHAAHDAGLAVVQTLHNYRLLCPAATFFRAGAVCEECLGRTVPWPGVLHACYRDSRAASAVTAVMLAAHRAVGTWHRAVDCFITPSEFAREKCIEGGLPPERVVAKSNFLDDDPGAGPHDGGYVLFVGRLSAEKGVATLLDAWRARTDLPPLVVAGDGPEAGRLRDAPPTVRWAGQCGRAEVLDLMRRAMLLVVPSVWYETFGLSVIEAYSTALPVVASGLGALAEVVEHERTGLLVPPGSAADLATATARLASDGALRSRLGTAARQVFETRYTGAANYDALIGVYEQALARSERRAAANRVVTAG